MQLPIWADYLILMGFAVALVAGAMVLLRRQSVRVAPPLWSMVGVAIAALASLVMSERAQTRTRESLRAQVSGLGPTFVYGLMERGYLGLSLSTPTDDPDYLRLIEVQKEWLRINPEVGDVYTFAKDPQGVVRLLLDSETDYDRDGHYRGERESRTTIGEAYEAHTELLMQAFDGEATFDDMPYSDRWGTWVSAFYPVKRADGTVHSVLGIDFPAELWVKTIADARRESLAYGAMMIVFLVGAGFTTRLLQRSLADAQERGRLIEAREQATRAASRAKGEFLANVSHELRTPLATIVGYSDLMLSPGEEPSVEHVRTIRRSAAQLLEMINDLLDMAKIESGQLATESIRMDPWEVARDVASMLSLRARERGLTLRLEAAGPIPSEVTSDPTRLRQVLTNLVGNAIKFTPKGSVTVRVAHEASSGGSLRFDVIDTGVGMTPAEMSRLFQPFQQADASTTRRFGGTGLGLAISRDLARRMGGDIEVRSELGAGSTFSARLATGPLGGTAMRQPAAEVWTPATTLSPEPSSQAEPQSTPVGLDATVGALRGVRVLLAEDAPDNQRLLQMFLTKAGASVECVGDGAAAVSSAWAAHLRRSAFDLILMDMQMPVLDGASATRDLRDRGYLGLIVALTAHASRGERERVLGTGCDEHLTKPVDRCTLVETCARLLSRGDQRKAA